MIGNGQGQELSDHYKEEKNGDVNRKTPGDTEGHTVRELPQVWGQGAERGVLMTEGGESARGNGRAEK